MVTGIKRAKLLVPFFRRKAMQQPHSAEILPTACLLLDVGVLIQTEEAGL